MGEMSTEGWRRAIEEDVIAKRKQNANLLRKRVKMYNRKKGPRVGDWVRLNNGVMTRFTYDWGIHEREDLGIQIGDRERAGDCGSFFLGDGYCSYSGSLDPCILRKNLRRTNKMKEGRVWFFHLNHWCADNGINFKVKFRVYREVKT